MLVAAAVAFLSAGCASQPTVGPPVSLPPNVDAMVRESVANKLRDPNAAQFRDVRSFQTPEGYFVCGQVNGKNAYGGYVGFVHFESEVKGSSVAWAALESGTGGDALVSSVWKSYHQECY